MKRKALTVFLLTALLLCGFNLPQAQAGDAQPPPKEIATLLDLWDKLNDQCRGGSGDDPKTQHACDERDKVFDQLKSGGWCYGEPDQAGYQMTWHPCK